MKYTKVATDAFKMLQINAGVLVDTFNPATGAYGNIIGATTGGISFNSNPTYEDFGEDVDNVPANTKQLKRITSYDPAISGTFLTVDAELVKKLSGAGTIVPTAGTTLNKIVPSQTLSDSDFIDLWVVGDYSASNEGADAGFVAIHIKNALNTTGFQLQTTKNGKGQFAFEFHGHYDLDNQDDVPYEMYVKGQISGSITVPDIEIINIADPERSVTATAVGFIPVGASSWNWSSSDDGVVTVEAGLTGGSAVLTANDQDVGEAIITVTCMGRDGLTRTATFPVHTFVE